MSKRSKAAAARKAEQEAKTAAEEAAAAAADEPFAADAAAAAKGPGKKRAAEAVPGPTTRKGGDQTASTDAAANQSKASKVKKLRSRGFSTLEVEVLTRHLNRGFQTPFVAADVEPRGCCWVFAHMAGLLPLPLLLDSSLLRIVEYERAARRKASRTMKMRLDGVEEEEETSVCVADIIMEAVFEQEFNDKQELVSAVHIRTTHPFS
jgi:hypothetical protein